MSYLKLKECVLPSDIENKIRMLTLFNMIEVSHCKKQKEKQQGLPKKNCNCHYSQIMLEISPWMKLHGRVTPVEVEVGIKFETLIENKQ